ncbi:hypothetical protein D3870_04240 [Noviherbaspirillum cavernae]|uniref:Uncharacterized protein n=1 Tax=Noviherbaspirillum cavernae TaxID=2320862 RepID=A0A418WYT1_9BURK|nr:hypothetical protein [Noviherbaspirillum cavernae]RJG05332.1 hypothetical protein D3870_04240 [Noviherbaspirillum cavernae]
MNSQQHDNARARRRIAGLAFCALLGGASHAEEINCPHFPEPKAKVEWVAPYMVYNGVPMSIKRFDSEQPPADVLAFYRQAWKGGPAGTAPVENTVGVWQTIAVVRGNCFFTVQVQAAGKNGSTGLLSATQSSDKVRVIDKDKTLPMLSGSTILNDIEHHDSGKTARTVVLSNTFSPETNANFYRQTLADQGWQPVSSYQMNTRKGPGITIVMKRGLAEASLVITRSGQNTNVLANLVDKP